MGCAVSLIEMRFLTVTAFMMSFSSSSSSSTLIFTLHTPGLSDPRTGGLRFNAGGDMVYFAANAGIIYNKRDHRQRFYIGHEGDIACMALDTPSRCVATGELARWPRVHVWDAQSAAPLGVSPRFHEDGICSIVFSPSGREIFSVGNDAKHTVAVWVSDTGLWHDIRLSCSGECGPSASNGIKCAIALRGAVGSSRTGRTAAGAKRAMWFTGGTNVSGCDASARSVPFRTRWAINLRRSDTASYKAECTTLCARTVAVKSMVQHLTPFSLFPPTLLTKHAMFWHSEAGNISSWRAKCGDFSDSSGTVSVSSVVLLADGTLATGTAAGDLLLWDCESATAVRSVQCHVGPLYALWAPPAAADRLKGMPHEDHGLLCVTGGCDGIVKSWGPGWRIKTLHTYELNTVPVSVAMGSAAGTAALAMGDAGGANSAATGALSGSGAGASASELAVRSICMDTLNGSLLVGTLGCDVIELYSSKGAPGSFCWPFFWTARVCSFRAACSIFPTLAHPPLVDSQHLPCCSRISATAALIASAHCRGELWGIGVHPTESTRFVTAGDDATMRVWDSEARQMVNMQQLDSGARALAFSPDGKTMAVGLGVGRPQPHLNNEGSFNIFTFERRGSKITLTNESRPAKSWIREMRFSADGDMCGCASDDSNVYVLGGSDFELRQTLRGLTGPATHLDFSTDGNHIQISSARRVTDEGDAGAQIAGHELTFHDPRTGEKIDEASKTRVRPFVLRYGSSTSSAFRSEAPR